MTWSRQQRAKARHVTAEPAGRVEELEAALAAAIEEMKSMDYLIHGEWGVGDYTESPAITRARAALNRRRGDRAASP